MVREEGLNLHVTKMRKVLLFVIVLFVLVVVNVIATNFVVTAMKY